MKKAVKDTLKQMNLLGEKKQPFFFLIDFLKTNAEVYPINDIEQAHIQIDFPGIMRNQPNPEPPPFTFHMKAMSFKDYEAGFNKVMKAINHGDSYLLNLTYPTPIDTNWSLDEIFAKSRAKYKVKYKDLFVVFSPETFIKIQDNTIRSFPMKGTLDAGIHNAEQKLMNDPKELAEHNTIVDLIRNDLSMVVKKVHVEKFRYLEKIQTHGGELLQTSSIISGELPPDWPGHLGDILDKLLPAGSISGAPKKRTLEIIEDAEGYDRGWFSGVCGYFDGRNLDSAVMIRFVENINGKLFFKSGGGITHFSKAKDEYNEMIEKVYIPARVGYLIETIKIKNRSIQNIAFHNIRFNKSRKELFGIKGTTDLTKEITIPDDLTEGTYKCRVTYARQIEKIEFEPYHRTAIRTLKCITANDLNYAYKFANRLAITQLLANKENFDDLLIIKDGLVTDTSFANIIFWDGLNWITP